MYKVALGAALLLFIHMWVKEVLREEENNKKRKEGLLSITSTDGELQKQIDIIRKYRHDIPKHIHMMEETIDGDVLERRFCDNELLNTITKIKEEECRQKNISIKIDFKLEKDAIEKINLSAVKVSGLIQNLLDNAIEENCRITDLKEREIKWTILQADFGLKMQIENACFDIDKIDFETKKEEKELHGWGVKIIKEIVDEAQGTIQYIKEKNNQLKVIVFLPFSEKKAADSVAGK